jgi:hypothetical protein
LPEKLWPLLAADSSPARRMLLARAALPLPPDLLVPSLAFLLRDPDKAVAEAAKRTLLDLPQGSVAGVLAAPSIHPGALDRLARLFETQVEYVQRIVANRVTSDDTLVHLARHGNMEVADLVAANEQRFLACPALVEALYFNRSARMSTVNRVVELAVREGLPLHSMPGYREIVAALYGEARANEILGLRPGVAPPAAPAGAAQPSQPAQPQAATPQPAQAPPQPAKPQPVPPQAQPMPPASPEAYDASLLGVDLDDLGEAGLGLTYEPGYDEEEGVGDEKLGNLLNQYAFEQGELEAADDDDSAMSKALWNAIRELSVAQRIRMALMGNGAARNLLIRDSYKIVAEAVLRNPQLTEKEVSSFAANKTLSEEIIRTISNTKEWLKNYMVKLNLVQNPKTPRHISIGLLRHLTDKDVKGISKSREVPGYITRAAREMVERKLRGAKPAGGGE